MKYSTIVFGLLSVIFSSSSQFIVANAFSQTSTTSTSSATSLQSSTSEIVKKVAVAGATGRTGSLVVEELVRRKVNVVALVRDLEKAKEKLPQPETSLEEYGSSISFVKCDLTSESDICNAIENCDAAIWCATGFSDAPGTSVFDKIKKLFGIAFAPKQSIDSIGVPALARAFLKSNDIKTDEGDQTGAPLPKVVMLSSAGVTRPSWDDEKKTLFPGAADIPIVRLNPFGILDIKKDSEEKLRETGVDYSIVRPCGLNDNWPSNSRYIFSQGDIAVGRINRKDVAKLLVDTLTSPSAVGKTFEAVTLTEYPPAPSIDKALSGLIPDSAGIPSNNMLQISYGLMQQLLPGETQDSAALAMGQTYEQLDNGERGRLGERGKEDAETAAPSPT